MLAASYDDRGTDEARMEIEEIEVSFRPPANKHEVKRVLNCGETKYWELMRKLEFKNAFRVGNQWRVPWADIEAYMERHRIGSAGDAA